MMIRMSCLKHNERSGLLREASSRAVLQGELRTRPVVLVCISTRSSRLSSEGADIRIKA